MAQSVSRKAQRYANEAFPQVIDNILAGHELGSKEQQLLQTGHCDVMAAGRASISSAS